MVNETVVFCAYYFLL